MGSCDFRWARKWGWPTIELHCTETCKHLSFSPPYSHCTTRLIILKLVHVHNHRLANTNNIFSVTAPFLGFDLLFTSRSDMPAVSYANAERWEPLKECIHWCGRSQWVLWLRIWEWLLSAHSGNCCPRQEQHFETLKSRFLRVMHRQVITCTGTPSIVKGNNSLRIKSFGLV